MVAGFAQCIEDDRRAGMAKGQGKGTIEGRHCICPNRQIAAMPAERAIPVVLRWVPPAAAATARTATPPRAASFAAPGTAAPADRRWVVVTKDERSVSF